MSRTCPYKEIPKNFYNKSLISDLCIEGKFYDDDETCDYGEWDWCTLHFTRPGLVIKDDLNQFNVTCESRVLNKKKGDCLIEESCFCIATGDYEGYYNSDLPTLKCKCYSKKSTYIPPISENGNRKQISNQEEKKRCECEGQKVIRRICETCNTFPTKKEGTCQLLKEKHRFENTIDCEDPIICAEIGKRLLSSQYSGDYLQYGLKWLGLRDQPNEQSIFTYGFPFKNVHYRDKTFRTKVANVFSNHSAQFAFLILMGIAFFLGMDNYVRKKIKKLKLEKNNSKKNNSKKNNSKNDSSKNENSTEENSTEETSKEESSGNDNSKDK